MVRDDLVCALRNALERGESMSEAIESLVNAGYNRVEIEEASRQIGSVRKKRGLPPPPPPMSEIDLNSPPAPPADVEEE
jgi:hypothetical protein